MKQLILMALFCLFTNTSFGQSQAKMNMDAQKKYEKANEELNAVYDKVLIKYEDNKQFISKLKTAQKMWIKFRDAEIEAKYPAKDGLLEYGSMYPMCWNIYLTDLTNQRIKNLNVWLKGTNDACAGSVKLKSKKTKR
jgi:uncharacterized protein YecT (DUF1311 family)